MAEPDRFLAPIRALHAHIRDAVVAATEHAAVAQMSAIAEDEAQGDTQYAIDQVGEAVLVDFLAREVAPESPLVLIAEGLPGGQVVLPHGTPEATAQWRVLVDPIDGTRGLMYQKRSAWVLTGIAPNRGPGTSLSDIVLAVMTEIPLVKQHLSDVLWAVKGRGAQAIRYNRLTGTETPLPLKPSTATSIAHGYATVARFFPGARALFAEIDDEIAEQTLGPLVAGKALCFEDQYISTGGQLYELIMGHDRFVADLRPYGETYLRQRGQALGLCCHPYDLAAVLIAQELGIPLTDGAGSPLDAPLNTTADVAWAGYANAAIKAQVEPVLTMALQRRGLYSPHSKG